MERALPEPMPPTVSYERRQLIGRETVRGRPGPTARSRCPTTRTTISERVNLGPAERHGERVAEEKRLRRHPRECELCGQAAIESRRASALSEHSWLRRPSSHRVRVKV